jgi:tetratricopeptide (TPR) repeat protein/predicted Ser/Thr protein kinase
MPSILYRLCEALLPDYEVEQELASGGMGMVFLARDVALDRMVAIKIVRPELATATATQRFLKEARILAKLHHPNTVAIHRAGEASGLFYYVMDFVEGETLGQRLKSGPLSRSSAVKLGRDVLDALGSVHAMNVVHRDIKPSNIFLSGDRALLADFGISTEPGPQTAAPSGALAVTGTPGYMPPEQAFGGDVTPQTDLYALGMVLYEALSGRRWEALLPGEPADWSGVPHSLQPILRKALAPEPKDRWPDARSFRHALWRTRTTKYRRRTLLLTASGLAAGAALVFTFARPGAPEAEWYDLAVLPLEETGATTPGIGGILASLAPGFLPASVRWMNPQRTAAWWDSAGPGVTLSDVPRLLRVRYVAAGTVSVTGDSLQVDLDLVNEPGRIQTVTPVHRRADDGFASIAAAVAHSITREIAGATQYEMPGVFSGRGDSALHEFVEGERAFHRNAWNPATDHYQAAIELDPGFPLASWRLAEVWRWQLEGRPPPDVDLRDLLDNHMGELGELDYRMIEAQLAPSLRERLARYAQIVADFPRDGYAAFLLGEEMMHRGALIGLPLDSAAKLLELATDKAPNLGPAWEHLFQVSVRLRRQEEARSALDRFTEVHAAESEVLLYVPPLYEMLYAGVFAPESAGQMFSPEILQDENLVTYLRTGAAFGAHRLMAQLAGLILMESTGDRAAQATAVEARALGLVALGRPAEALQLFDQAALVLGSAEASFQAAEWRVVPAALGIPGIPDTEVARGRAALEGFTRQPAFAARAAWALGLDAYTAGDLETGSGWLDQLRAASHDSLAARLSVQLEAAELAARGRWLFAVERTDALLAFDSAGMRHGDPFGRAALHLQRAEWFDRAGEPSKADSARSWYEHMILRIRLVSEAEPAEIDWALGGYAEYRRAVAAAERGDRQAACRRFGRVAALWSDPEAAYRPLQQEATERIAGCPA